MPQNAHMPAGSVLQLRKKYNKITTVVMAMIYPAIKCDNKKWEDRLISLISDYTVFLLNLTPHMFFFNKETSDEYSRLLCKLKKYQTCGENEFNKFDYYESVYEILRLLKKRNKSGKKRRPLFIKWQQVGNKLNY